MKTKRSLAILTLVLVLILSFAACARNNSTSNMSAPQEESYVEGEKSYDLGETDFQSLAGRGSDTDTEMPSPNDKIIYSGYAEIETLDFEKTLEDLETMIAQNGGFVQSSSINGNDFNTSYYGGKSYRSANYSIRIPSNNFKSVTEGLSVLGNVPYSSSNAENITMQYRDTASRLAARETEQTRLLELLSKADTIEEILLIETRLSDVRYDIESLTTQIKGWDSLISYSTLDLGISEVTLYTEGSTSTLSYGEQLSEGFVRTLRGVGRFFQNAFKLIVISLPVLMVLAVVAVGVIFIIKITRKKRAPKATVRQEQDRQDS